MLFSAFSSIGQDVLTLEKGQQPGKATLKQVEWLKGYWTGTGLGGDCEELWMPANDSSMHGVFRFAKNNSLQFTEYMVIEEKNGTLTVRIKHFGAGVEPWEEKDKWVEFPLVKAEGETAWFSGLTYARSGMDLIVTLRMKQGEKRYTEEFRFRKSAL
jgi:hypothetical protein